jgi:preprotein translocase subunit SecA
MGLFGFLNNDNKRHIKKLTAYAKKVDALSDKYAALSEDELKAQTQIFKNRLSAGETLDDILPEAFAAVREASFRVLGMKHFFVQVMGGICLHQGRIAEMRTGEGKTLVATLPAYLNALSGKGVHIVTVNEYLAKRDCEWMGKIYKYLGLSVGVIFSQMNHKDKQAAYNSDICYATNNELGFDYLRDNMAINKADMVQRELSYAIVDEVDSILVDEARTPLIISGRGNKSSDMYISANRFVRGLKKDEDVDLNEEDKQVRLTESGVKKAESFFNLENLSDVENTETNHHINQALKAHNIMKRDNDYIISDGEVMIVDEFTGRILPGRRYSEGLHQAIEAKEGVKIQNENKTLATITFQNYFRLYKKLSGMTGTAKTEEEEFNNIYSLDVVSIPTNLEMIREDLNDVIFKTVPGKLRAIVGEIADCHKSGQPVLVGTITVEKSEELSGLLKKNKIPHNVLNAKNHEQEAEIIAQAGKIGQVTIATNMAGRGTDILLGGNPEYMAKARMKKGGFSDDQISQATSYAHTDDAEIIRARDEFKRFYNEHKIETDKEKVEVIALGGLHILGTERHESRRIDNQLRGRSGRQGDPGSSIFYISVEDDLTRVFGGEKMQARLARIFTMFRVDEDTPIQAGLLSKQIEGAQKRIEGRNFGIRKTVLQYDDVMNNQRSEIYGDRQKVLKGESVHGQILDMIRPVVEELFSGVINPESPYTEWNLERANKEIEDRLLPAGAMVLTHKMVETTAFEEINETLLSKVVEAYEEKYDDYKRQGIDYGEIERIVLLRVVDDKWTEHIDAMDQLRRGIGLKAYGQQDPVAAYKREGYEMYRQMTEHIAEDAVLMLLKLKVEQAPVLSRVNTNELHTSKLDMEKGQKQNKGGNTKPQISRNANCPCGSRKKYKHCCGKDL